jgi:hypothetical protein
MGHGELILDSKRVFQIGADSPELGLPSRQRIWLPALQHVAHRVGGGVQIILNSQELKRIPPVSIHEVYLQLLKACDLGGHVPRINNYNGHDDRQPNEQTCRGRFPGKNVSHARQHTSRSLAMGRNS